jgi:hypothetical protein
MGIDFVISDVVHKITGKFVRNHLPDAKKPYVLRAKFQPELDVHGIASKGAMYNIATDPKIIEEGFNTACVLIYYLTADGYKCKTPLFNTVARISGEYDGSETSLPDGVKAEVHMQRAAAFRRYIEEHCEVFIDGVDNADGLIAEAVDEKTGHVDDVATIGNLLTIHGLGLKIEGDEAHKDQMGVFFVPPSGLPLKAEIIAVNEHRTLKLITPPTLTAGTEYTLRIFTMSSGKGGGALLKTVRDMRSEFKLTAQN